MKNLLKLFGLSIVLSIGRTLRKKEPHTNVTTAISTYPVDVACFNIVHTFEQLHKFGKPC
jgi:hypothetical protein